MRRIDRYVLKELAVPMLLGTFGIALLFLGNELIAVFKNFETTNAPLVAAFQLAFYRMPFWMSITLPAGVALATALAVSRLKRESEVTAMRAAGISVFRILLPIVTLGVAAAGLNYWNGEFVVPQAAEKYRETLMRFGRLTSIPRIQSNVMLRLDRYTASFGTVQRTDEGLLLRDIVVLERPKSGETFVYLAPTGDYQDGVWTFQNPTWFWFRGIEVIGGTSEEEPLVVNERIDLEALISSIDPTEETAAELEVAIDKARALGQSTSTLEVSLHSKYAIAASCVVFSITGAVAALLFANLGPFSGILISIGIVILYLNSFVISTEVLGRGGILSPMAAAWLPNLLFGMFALFAYRYIR